MVALETKIVVMDLHLNERKVYRPNQVDPCVKRVWMMSTTYR